MWDAIIWGAVAGSATLLGAVVILLFSVSQTIIGYIMALGTGALIGATTYELLDEAVNIGGYIEAAIGFLGGALVFTILDYIVSKQGGRSRKASESQQSTQSGVAIFIGTIMDAIPESAMIGASLVSQQSVSISLVVAIFISNFPEGLSSSVGLKSNGKSKGTIVWMWMVVLLISTLSSMAGYFLLEKASESVQAVVSAFAGGGITAMIASTMMPEAYKEGGPAVGFMTAVGVFVTLLLN